MLQTMGNNMDAEMSQMILADIARLRKMPALAYKIENYKPQPNPLVQEKAALEVELLRAQIANETAKADENRVDVGLKTAKTATENAKARNLDSKSDQQDLDFLDKESGADREHEINKLEHGRGTQLDLKAAENMLKPEEVPATKATL